MTVDIYMHICVLCVNVYTFHICNYIIIIDSPVVFRGVEAYYVTILCSYSCLIRIPKSIVISYKHLGNIEN